MSFIWNYIKELFLVDSKFKIEYKPEHFNLDKSKWSTTNPSFVKLGDEYIVSLRLIYEDYYNTGNETFLFLGRGKSLDRIKWNAPISLDNKNKKFTKFRGLEDIRLFVNGPVDLYILGVSLQLPNWEGIPQMVLGKLDKKTLIPESLIHLKCVLGDSGRIPGDSGRIPEKNWLPIRTNSTSIINFIHSWSINNVLGKKILKPIFGRANMKTGITKIQKDIPNLEIRGSTVPIWTNIPRPNFLSRDTSFLQLSTTNSKRWVCLVHTCEPFKNSRIYHQKWVEFDHSGNVSFVSKDFTLSNKQHDKNHLEFPMSMVVSTDTSKGKWLVCYGKDDKYSVFEEI
jgi:hypothetical protein